MIVRIVASLGLRVDESHHGWMLADAIFERRDGVIHRKDVESDVRADPGRGGDDRDSGEQVQEA